MTDEERKAKRREYSRKWRENNRDRYNELQREHQARNKDKRSASNRRDGLMRRYGLTVEQYDDMYEAQAGRCALCGDEKLNAKGKGNQGRLHVDHCHATGKVRELLCHGCNTGMGGLQHNPDLLEKAAAYIRHHQ